MEVLDYMTNICGKTWVREEVQRWRFVACSENIEELVEACLIGPSSSDIGKPECIGWRHTYKCSGMLRC